MKSWAVLIALQLLAMASCEMVYYAPFDSPQALDVLTEQCRFHPSGDSVSSSGGGPVAAGGVIGGLYRFAAGGGTATNVGLVPSDEYAVETNSFTMALWAKFPTTTAFPLTAYPLLQICSSSLSQDVYPATIGFTLTTPPTRYLNYKVETTDDTFQLSLTDGIDITAFDTSWLHIALTFDGAGISLYLNGTLTSSSPTTGALINVPSSIVGLGRCSTADQNFRAPSLSEEIDEVRVYDTALTQEEILELVQLDTAPTPPPIDPFVDNPINTSVADAGDLSITPNTATAPEDLGVFWTDISGCGGKGIALIEDPTSFELDVTFVASADSPATLQCALVDLLQPSWNRVCSAETLDLDVSDSAPIVVQNITIVVNGQEEDEIYANDGNVVLRVVTGGFPLPSVQWEEFILANFTNTSVTPPVQQVGEIWSGISGATNASLTITPNSDGGVTFLRHSRRGAFGRGDDGSIRLRVSLSNRAGVAFTEERVVTILPGNRPGSGSDGDGDSNPAVLGGIVGGLAGAGILAVCCVCICAVCIIILLLIFLVVVVFGGVSAVKKAKRGFQIKLPDPDFNTLAFGSAIEPKHSLNSSQRAALDRLADLFDDGMLLASIIVSDVKATEAEKIAKALIFLYHSCGSGNEVLSFFIAREVEYSDKEGTLFRANSIASKMFNAFAKMVGLPYIFSIFARPVNELKYEADKADGIDESNDGGSSLMEPLTLEVDPTRLDDAADATINTLALRLTAQKLFDALRKSSGRVPREFRRTLLDVHEEVDAKFSSAAAYKAMGGFIFLRFFCPSLMAPQVYGLLEDPPSSTCQRQLILIAKIMQNLANDTLPGKKEEYMQDLNHFISDNKAALERFYQTLRDSADSGPTSNISVPSSVRYNAIADLAEYLSQYQSRLESTASSMEGGSELMGQVNEALSDIHL